MINMPQLRVKRGSVIKRQKSQTASDYEWLRVTTSDYKWLRAGVRVTTSHYNWLRETTSQAPSDCKWPRMTASDYQPSYEWLQLGLAITLGIKAFIISYYNNKQSKYVEKCSKNSCATLLVKIIEKCSRCRSSHLQMFFKVSVLKKALSPAILLKRYSNTKVFLWNLRNF